ncbi:copper ion transmembrane transporter [Tanacetum coccineum]
MYSLVTTIIRVVTVAEILKNNGLAVKKKVVTSTIGMKDETRGRLIQKARLERPWEVVEKAPKLFSVTADEQLKVFADRFQKPGGFDLWFEKDRLQSFETVEGIPSARFFPKGVVHSIKPYGRISDGYSDQEEEDIDSIEKK